MMSSINHRKNKRCSPPADSPVYGSMRGSLTNNGNDVEPHTVGDIIVQSKSIMVGYWHMEEETARTLIDGWLHTGDMGYYDETRLHVYCRQKERLVIIPAVKTSIPVKWRKCFTATRPFWKCAVIGVPDEVWVERVHAVIVLKEGQQATADEIMSFLQR